MPPRASVSLAPRMSSMLWSSLITLAVRTVVHPDDSQNPCPAILDCPLELVLPTKTSEFKSSTCQTVLPWLLPTLLSLFAGVVCLPRLAGTAIFILRAGCSSTSARWLFDIFTLYGFLCLGSFIKSPLDVNLEYLRTPLEL